MCCVIVGVMMLALTRAGDRLTGNNGQDQGADTGDNTHNDTEQSANIIQSTPGTQMGLHPLKEYNKRLP